MFLALVSLLVVLRSVVVAAYLSPERLLGIGHVFLIEPQDFISERGMLLEPLIRTLRLGALMPAVFHVLIQGTTLVLIIN